MFCNYEGRKSTGVHTPALHAVFYMSCSVFRPQSLQKQYLKNSLVCLNLLGVPERLNMDTMRARRAANNRYLFNIMMFMCL